MFCRKNFPFSFVTKLRPELLCSREIEDYTIDVNDEKRKRECVTVDTPPFAYSLIFYLKD